MLIGISVIVIILLFVLLAILTFARNLLATFLNAIVRFFRKLVGRGQEQEKTEGRQTVRNRTRSKKKVLSDSDGEYVDFEEVKK